MKCLIFFAPFAVVLLSGCGSSNPGTLSTGTTPGTTVPPSPPGPPAVSSSSNFVAVGSMNAARADHVAVLLPNGKVLIAGGVSNAGPLQPLASAELYDPSTQNFTPTGSMMIPRNSPGAVLLANGKVLIVGGSQNLSAEIYDPSTGVFTSAGNMVSGGDPQNALDSRLPTLLQDGRVLVEGVNAEIYDPATGAFSLIAAYADASPLWFTSTLLQDGRVLLTGCVQSCGSGANELHDPRTNTFTSTGPLSRWDDVNTATPLMDGKVLFVGNDENDNLPADAELYDPTAGMFASVGNAIEPHEFAAAVRLSSGTVLITGGQLIGGPGSAGAELFDPSTEIFT
jgi:hypothetical protein